MEDADPAQKDEPEQDQMLFNGMKRTNPVNNKSPFIRRRAGRLL
jgi:hypothetical protein